jgi:NADH-quinone oxidoreductase subunit J
MSAELALFYVFGALALGSAVAMGLLAHNLVAGVACLATTLLSLAGIYVLLEAHFVAVVQVLLYAGAIPLLLLCVVLLGELRDGVFGPLRPRHANRAVLLVTAALLVLGLVASQLPEFADFTAAPVGFGGFRPLGLLLYRDFLVPLALLGALLLAGVVAAGVFAKGGAAE